MQGDDTVAVAAFAAKKLGALGLQVFERGWLSSNGIACVLPDAPTAIIDTGYGSHAALTLALMRSALGGRELNVIVNTHLHSDHCGGNAVLQQAYPGARTLVPITQLNAVMAWDQDVLTYERTGQQCDRYRADEGLHHGQTLRIGHHDWQVLHAPGHDPDALMLWQSDERVLISGDALWERRLAIIFPALSEEGAGFDDNEAVLNSIEALHPALVIPGHGRPFNDVAAALASSRRRLAHYRKHPQDHTDHARKALLMFHMLEHQSREEAEALQWLRHAPVLNAVGMPVISETEAQACLDGLVGAGVLARIQKGRIQLVAGRA